MMLENSELKTNPNCANNKAMYLHIRVTMTMLSYIVLKTFSFLRSDAYYTKCISNMYLIIGVCNIDVEYGNSFIYYLLL